MGFSYALEMTFALQLGASCEKSWWDLTIYDLVFVSRVKTPTTGPRGS